MNYEGIKQVQWNIEREKRIKKSFRKLFDVGEDKQKCAGCGHVFWQKSIFGLSCDWCRVEMGAMVSPWFDGFPLCICCK